MHTDTQSGASSTDEVREKASQTAATVVDQAQQVATTQFSSQKERVASTLDTVAHSIHATGSSLEDQQPQIASLAHQAADRVASASSYVRQHDLNDVVTEVESLARREPALFLGAAFAIGFVGARFLKASSSNSSSYSNNQRRMTSGYDQTMPYQRASGYGASTGYGTSDYAGTAGSGLDGNIGSTNGYGTNSGLGTSDGLGDGSPSGYGTTTEWTGDVGSTAMNAGYGTDYAEAGTGYEPDFQNETNG